MWLCSSRRLKRVDAVTVLPAEELPVVLESPAVAAEPAPETPELPAMATAEAGTQMCIRDRRKVWNVQTFKEAIKLVDDDLLLLCMHLAFACSLRVGEITGLTWDDVIVDEEAIANNNARVIVNKELARI